MSESQWQIEALVLLDHGSRSEQATLESERLAEHVRASFGNRRRVFVAHLEASSPSIEDLASQVHQDPSIKRVLVAPLFFFPGKHLVKDIPSQLEASFGSRGIEWSLLPHLAAWPGFADWITQQIVELESQRT